MRPCWRRLELLAKEGAIGPSCERGEASKGKFQDRRDYHPNLIFLSKSTSHHLLANALTSNRRRVSSQPSPQSSVTPRASPNRSSPPACPSCPTTPSTRPPTVALLCELNPSERGSRCVASRPLLFSQGSIRDRLLMLPVIAMNCTISLHTRPCSSELM